MLKNYSMIKNIILMLVKIRNIITTKLLTKANTLLIKILSSCYGKTCFGVFQNKELIQNQRRCCENSSCIYRVSPKKLHNCNK